ncbi:MAG: TonB-dependent receptor [Acidobacteria bacterium]|nr:TonB-dependent receptor [Acidobacteriota bacterium]
MVSAKVRVCAWVLAVTSLCIGARPASAQLVTASITGVVTDNSAASLPGVTVTVKGERLIGDARTLVTDTRGHYRFDNLPPGTYAVRFELAGFKSVDRPDVQVAAAFVATINAQLEVGAIEETITVSGDSPTVDTKSNVQQTVMNQELLEGVPTGRDVWSVAKIIPGVAVGTYDVGGTQGMQQSAMSAHGSRTDDKTFAIDGISVNWPGGGGGSTMVYYDQGMFEEVNYQTSAIPAEVSIGGIYMNMVTKAGGNRWRGDLRAFFASDATQSENFADVSKQFNFPGGNPVDTQYDLNMTVAGPVMKDRIWFFGSYRRWRVDKLVLSVTDPDGSHPVDDNRIWNASGKVTTQANANHRLGVVYNYNQKYRGHRNDAGPAFISSEATTLQDQPGWTAQAKYTGVLRGSSVFESTFGGVGGTYPELYQPTVKPTDYRRFDQVLSTATGAAPRNYENPNTRLQFDNVFSHTANAKGTHNLKFGVQFSRMDYREKITANNDTRQLEFANGVPVRIVVSNTGVDAKNFVRQLGFFAQDSWSAGKLTLNVGLRVDNAKGWYPDQSAPAGAFVQARSLPGKAVYNQWLAVWRAGAVFDLFGDGRTAIKGNYSRYGHQVGIGLVTNVNPMFYSTANIAWTDRNGDRLPQPSELGAFEGFTGGATTRYTDENGPDWGYSDELTAGIEHQLIRDVRVGVMYYHRTNRKLLGGRNMAVPQTAYTPAQVTNPLGGTVTVYNLLPAYVGRQDTVRENIPALDTDYDGVEVTATKRFSRRWQMLFGFTVGKNVGGIDLGDFNDPNNLVNQQGKVGNDATYSLKIAGTYVIPKIELSVAGSALRNTGYPRHFSYSVNRAAFAGLTRSSQTVYVNARGDERLPSVSMVDLRLSRRFRFSSSMSIEPQLDIFNVANNDVIVNMVNTLGSRLGYPSEILAPRIVRVGVAVQF